MPDSKTFRHILFFALIFTFTSREAIRAQQNIVESIREINDIAAPHNGAAFAHEDLSKLKLRAERLKIDDDAELLTIFGDVFECDAKDATPTEMPLVSIVRDTLGDENPHNDKLRYVWMLTYTRPNIVKRLAAAVPFLYGHTGTQSKLTGKSAPPVIFDLADQTAFNRFLRSGVQTLLFNTLDPPLQATTRAYRRNASDYQRDHINRALTILALYDAAQGENDNAKPLLSFQERQDVQARLMLSDSLFGGVVDETKLDDTYEQRKKNQEERISHNWELLRQRAETEGLIFEPLTLPDGSATHALVWVARQNALSNAATARKFDSRFLNIADPFHDKRLKNWKGYSETPYFDAENRPTAKETPNARAVEMIPLALYGLDYPKIPVLLSDFRDANNPKLREVSRRAIDDAARNILGLSPFGDVPYFLGRKAFDFITGRKGVDFNQPSRLRAYSQLKLLLALNASLQPELRARISRRAEKIAPNPLENNYQAEVKLARQQYAALIDYARRPGGLVAQLARDRRAELVPQSHGKKALTLYHIANIVSLGIYTRRENLPPQEVNARLDVARQLASYRRYLREIVKSTPLIEVVWNIEEVRRALEYISTHGTKADVATVNAIADIFTHTEDIETRQLCLASLYRINNDEAKAELLKIYRAPKLEPHWRELSANYLQKAASEGQRIAPEDAKAIAGIKKQ